MASMDGGGGQNLRSAQQGAVHVPNHFAMAGGRHQIPHSQKGMNGGWHQIGSAPIWLDVHRNFQTSPQSGDRSLLWLVNWSGNDFSRPLVRVYMELAAETAMGKGRGFRLPMQSLECRCSLDFGPEEGSGHRIWTSSGREEGWDAEDGTNNAGLSPTSENPAR